MADDFRVTVLLDDGSGEGLGERLSEYEHELEEEAKATLGEAVAVSADGPTVFLYADTLEAARSARDVVAGILEREGLTATFALDRWHPLASEWKPADEPLPESESAREAELDEREAVEEAESRETGLRRVGGSTRPRKPRRRGGACRAARGARASRSHGAGRTCSSARRARRTRTSSPSGSLPRAPRG